MLCSLSLSVSDRCKPRGVKSYHIRHCDLFLALRNAENVLTGMRTNTVFLSQPSADDEVAHAGQQPLASGEWNNEQLMVNNHSKLR